MNDDTENTGLPSSVGTVETDLTVNTSPFQEIETERRTESSRVKAQGEVRPWQRDWVQRLLVASPSPEDSW